MEYLVPILMGLMFIVVGTFVLIDMGEWMALIFIFLGTIVTLACLDELRNTISLGRERKKTLAKGVVYHGKIVGYEDGFGTVVNGVPPLDVVIEFNDGTETKTVRIATGSHDEDKYPLGAYCDIRMLGVNFAIDPSSLRF